MKNILNNINQLSTQIVLGLIFGLVLFPSLGKTYVIIVFGLTILIKAIKLKKRFNTKIFLQNGSLYLLILLTFFYSENQNNAFFLLQTMSSLIIFPLIFSMFDKNDFIKSYKNLKSFFWIYIAAICLFNTAPFLWYWVTQDTLLEIVTHYPRAIIIDFGRYTIHPMYISMHNCIAIVFSVYLIKNTTTKLEKYALYILILVLSIFLIIYMKKGPIISLFITFSIWSFLDSNLNVRKSIIIILSLVGLVLLIPSTRKKFLELTNVKMANSIEDATSSNIRLTIYNNSIKLIKKSPYFGYGIGDVNDKLKQSYKKNAPFLLDKKYNSHNQYLSFILLGGLGLLIYFVFLYWKTIVEAFQSKNILLIVVMCFYSIMMFFENILEREHGVIFFSFFINFFSLKNYFINEEK
ncbi:MAG: O-antigen ligase family protein [Polaribacter sp.]